MDRPDELPRIAECFNFAEPSGRWIWSATTPDRILVVDGVRRYQAVRFLPRVPGSLTLEAVLEAAEAAPYFTGVRELMSWRGAGHLAVDGC
ncbi:hypothetical protein [Streptomyces erythrochromogenes]|uniref:hypothetical protein n=1 Tax=Streptomyces erythrochromogenes TaxID=285574 RepID=UPI0037F68299